MQNPIFLNEYCNSTSGFEITEEKTAPNSSWKSLKIKGIFQRADSKNQNGRVYPLAVLENALQEVNESLMSKNMMGETDHPTDSSPTVSLKNVSHVITNLKFQGKELIGEAIIFDDPGPAGTPMGRMLGALIRNNCTVGISSRGYGSVSNNYEGTVVNEYKLITFDAVHDPSTHQAYIHPVNEGVSYKKQVEDELKRKEFQKYLRTEFNDMLFKK